MRCSSLFAALALTVAAPLAQAADAEQAIRKTLNTLQPDLKVESVSASPLKGLHQVQLEGGRVLYMSEDGQYLMQGYLYQMRDGQMVNLTEQAENVAVARQLNALPRNEMVIFAPKNPKTHITVFTDTDCGYCQLLHKEVAELNRQGVEVRYLAYPRAGVGSPTYETLVSVWCAKNPQEAMNQAKARKKVPAATCENPVAKQFELGQRIGVQGTPAIFLANGQLIPGYQPADKLGPTALQAR
ncbi:MULTISPECIES: DsbC family protein [Pseudomonas]|uniref:Thiol:disulfide interchange protein n=1 Tax=Pseudomonas flexibilis TaxID=706570 RepID=A0A0B3BWV5_9PSED|nr:MULTISPECIES: DsbC family protein [Pseudomonas]KHL69836.1 protein-disulfide isomerase [Pseudomonas flexibilis]KHO65541.1 protein-disulfide isomerase [Pseudomonas flexibilis]SCX80878.1 Thiol:disulfide interchange protein DsbC [Pseudomonas flexibilis]SIQ52215.1 Thiol:disulfide interchange protein DsbC [Pseudomonas flexibilis]